MEYLRDKVVGLLRRQKTAISRDQIAQDLCLPTYAVDAGLLVALDAELVTFAAGQGYWIAPGVPKAVGAEGVAHV